MLKKLWYYGSCYNICLIVIYWKKLQCWSWKIFVINHEQVLCLFFFFWSTYCGLYLNGEWEHRTCVFISYYKLTLLSLSAHLSVTISHQLFLTSVASAFIFCVFLWVSFSGASKIVDFVFWPWGHCSPCKVVEEFHSTNFHNYSYQCISKSKGT